MLLPPGAQVAKGIFLGATLVCPYGFAHFCFVIPRGFGLPKRLLTPATPLQLVLAKYASAFSVALFIVNIPGLMLRDLGFLFHANAAGLLMTTAAVISPKPWAPLIPLWVVFIPWFYLPAQLKEQFGWVADHATAASIAELCAIPVIMYYSAMVFQLECCWLMFIFCPVIDGVYAAGDDGRPEFHALPAPENEDVLR